MTALNQFDSHHRPHLEPPAHTPGAYIRLTILGALVATATDAVTRFMAPIVLSITESAPEFLAGHRRLLELSSAALFGALATLLCMAIMNRRNRKPQSMPPDDEQLMPPSTPPPPIPPSTPESSASHHKNGKGGRRKPRASKPT